MGWVGHGFEGFFYVRHFFGVMDFLIFFAVNNRFLCDGQFNTVGIIVIPRRGLEAWMQRTATVHGLGGKKR